MGRATQGVRLINLKGKDSIAAVAKVMKDEDEETEDIELTDLENTENLDSGTTIDTNEEE